MNSQYNISINDSLIKLSENNQHVEFKDKPYKPYSGCNFFLLYLIYFSITNALFIGISAALSKIVIGLAVGIPLSILPIFILCCNFFVIDANNAAVITRFGRYIGTVRDPGFYWINPLLKIHSISTRLINHCTPTLKVNDKAGNPILIGAVLLWRVSDCAKALLDVENYNNFVQIQTESAIRRLAYSFNYDKKEDTDICLKDGHININNFLRNEISTHLKVAGIEIHSAEIASLSYAPEIANAMLRRQQAEAVVSARKTIIEGAVGICGMAVSSLRSNNIVELDNDSKTKLVSNLLVVLCSESQVNPVIKTN